MELRVLTVVLLPELLQHRFMISQCSGIDEHTCQGPRLQEVIVSPLVVFRGRDGTVEADNYDKGRQGKGAGLKVLLYHEAADCGDDHQDIVGQHGALIFRLPELLAVLRPIRQYRILRCAHGPSFTAQPGTGPIAPPR